MDEIEFTNQLFCGATKQRRYWTNHTRLGIGRVCNAPIMEDGTCPNESQHASNAYGDD